MKKKSDNLSSGTTQNISKKISSSSSRARKPSVSAGKRSASGSPGKSTKSSAKSKKAAVPRSRKPANVSLSPVTALRTANKPKHSNRNIGVKAKGRYVKTLYELTRGKEGEAEKEALKGGLRQIQNLANKRIEKLVALEKETGVTAPALHELRQTGFAHGVSLKGYGTDSDMYREQYKAFLDFLKDKTSTREGVTRNMLDIQKELIEAGWKPNGEDIAADTLQVHLTAEQYEKFKALATEFYDEQNKYRFYLQSDANHNQDNLRETINKEIVALLDEGDLDTVLQMAQNRMEEIYRENVNKF